MWYCERLNSSILFYAQMMVEVLPLNICFLNIYIYIYQLLYIFINVEKYRSLCVEISSVFVTRWWIRIIFNQNLKLEILNYIIYI